MNKQKRCLAGSKKNSQRNTGPELKNYNTDFEMFQNACLKLYDVM